MRIFNVTYLDENITNATGAELCMKVSVILIDLKVVGPFVKYSGEILHTYGYFANDAKHGRFFHYDKVGLLRIDTYYRGKLRGLSWHRSSWFNDDTGEIFYWIDGRDVSQQIKDLKYDMNKITNTELAHVMLSV